MGLDKVQIIRGAVSGVSHRARTVEDTRGERGLGVRNEEECVFGVCVCVLGVTTYKKDLG